VPVSPCSNTVGAAALPSVSKVARWRSCVRKACMAGDGPTSWAVGSDPGSDAERAIDILHDASSTSWTGHEVAATHGGNGCRWRPLYPFFQDDSSSLSRGFLVVRQQQALWHDFCPRSSGACVCEGTQKLHADAVPVMLRAPCILPTPRGHRDRREEI